MSFAADIAKFVERAKGNIDTATRQATVMLAQGVILKSPVDTGRFRANWQFSAVSIQRATTTALDRGGQVTMNRLVAEIQRTGAGGVTYLSNSLPYAARLENGWSKQAPQGMVRLTVQEFQNYVSQAAKDANK
ncbi:HK97 gp10 family phage protein [Achromobacter denitrificans]|uniref:HK97 gp10 family phage protein n=1 Tax=Achromobacter denitrificans TaxID=32002 RepID=UPI000F67C77D|nr:HK97 gp10 family phage protein [Achromobacter denitrificans]RSE85576.1 HK97 gp10 family phage protein [Achromobacter denitrificans]